MVAGESTATREIEGEMIERFAERGLTARESSGRNGGGSTLVEECSEREV